MVWHESVEDTGFVIEVDVAASRDSGGDARYRLFVFPLDVSQSDAVTEISAAGWEVMAWMPEHAYVARRADDAEGNAKPSRVARALTESGLPLTADWRMGRDTRQAITAGGSLEWLVTLWPGEDATAVAEFAEAIGARVAESHPEVAPLAPARLIVAADAGTIERLAGNESIRWIEPRPIGTPRNDVETAVVQSGTSSLRPMWDRNLMGQGQIIGHIDTGLHLPSCYLRDVTLTVAGPSHRKVVAYRGTVASSPHGTHTAATLVGFNINGATALRGHAPLARLSHTANTSPPSLASVLESARVDGAFVHSNSWGVDSSTSYTAYCVDIDNFSYIHEDQLVLFAVTNTQNLATPENAKNVLAVGATKSFPALDEVSTAGRGPTRDSRRKPEIFAPGQSVQSAAPADCSINILGGTSMACPAVAGAAVLARQYFVEGWYPTGGPNAADSLVPSGALLKALLINSTRDMTGLPGYPSPADPLDVSQSDREGFGRLLLDDALWFPGETRRLVMRDRWRDRGEGLAQGESYTFPLSVLSPSEPLRIILAWMDPPAAQGTTQASVNNLDLTVKSPTGALYRGNVFDNSASSEGGSADPRNNVEMALRAAPEVGTWLVTIEAQTVNPLFGGGRQGFAVAATGALAPDEAAKLWTDPLHVRTDTTVSAFLHDANRQSGTPVGVSVTTPLGDSETVVLDWIDEAIAAGAFNTVTGVAIQEDGLLQIAPSQLEDAITLSYLDPDPGAIGPTAHLETLSVPILHVPTTLAEFLSEDVTDSEALVIARFSDRLASGHLLVRRRDVPSDLGTSHPLQRVVGGQELQYGVTLSGLAPGMPYAGEFHHVDLAGSADQVAVPSLFTTHRGVVLFASSAEPDAAGMVSDAAVGGPSAAWRPLTTNLSRSAPSAWFSPNLAFQQDARLVSPQFLLDVPGATDYLLDFHHTHRFEVDQFDGGVVEISTDGGQQWTDLGDTFLRNGYNGIIAENPANVLIGRPAFAEGFTGAMRLTRGSLLAGYAGQSIILRWRLGADAAVSATGWYIDDITVRALVPAEFSQPSADMMLVR